MTSTSRSPERSCTSFASVSSPHAVSGPIHRTSEAPMRHRCSSCSSTSTTGGPAMTRSSAPLRATLAPRWIGSRTAVTPTATATSNTNAATRPAAWSTSAGRTAGTRSSSPTARSPEARSRPARSRAMSTTRNDDPARLAREVWNDTTLSEPPRGTRAPPAGALSTRLLDARARLSRPCAGRRQTPGRQPDVQHRTPPVVRDPRRRRSSRDRRTAARRAALLGLGRPNPRHATRPATTRSATTPGRSGRTRTR